MDIGWIVVTRRPRLHLRHIPPDIFEVCDSSAMVARVKQGEEKVDIEGKVESREVVLT